MSEDTPNTHRPLLEEIKALVLRGMREGSKPKLPEDVERTLTNAIHSVLYEPEQNTLISILPEFRTQARDSLLSSLTLLAKEAKRMEVLGHFKDAETVRAFAELLLIDFEELRMVIGGQRPDASVAKDIERLAALQDVTFIHQFLESEALIAKELGLSNDVALHRFPPHARLYLATRSKDPLARAKEVNEALETLLTDEGIATHLPGVATENIQRIFVPGVRLHLALKFKNPEIELRAIKDRLDTVLTDEALAPIARMTPEEVHTRVSLYDRLYFAVHNPRDPLKGFDRWVKGEITGPNGRKEFMPANGK
jgi:hypothetical protein